MRSRDAQCNTEEITLRSGLPAIVSVLNSALYLQAMQAKKETAYVVCGIACVRRELYWKVT